MVVKHIVPIVFAMIPNLLAAISSKFSNVLAPLPIFVGAIPPGPSNLVPFVVNVIPVADAVVLEVVDRDVVLLLPLVPLIDVVVMDVVPLVRAVRP